MDNIHADMWKNCQSISNFDHLKAFLSLGEVCNFAAYQLRSPDRRYFCYFSKRQNSEFHYAGLILSGIRCS